MLEITGKVIKVNVVKEGVDKNGAPYVIRDVVTERMDGEFVKHAVLSVYSTATKPKWNELGLELGHEYSLKLDIDAREYNGRWFNTIRIWSATEIHRPDSVATPVSAATQQVVQKLEPKSNLDPCDVLPF